MTCAETIKEITRTHLTENNGVALGQCLSAVGWVGGTVPELRGHPNLIELSMDDTSGSGLAVGYALAGRKPIFICRYQGFMWFNSVFFTNYAAKARALWGYDVPIFIRAISMEGGIGPVAGSSHHGMIVRMPGIEITAPMTPKEYRRTWNRFMERKSPIYVSEHRRSFPINYEMPNEVNGKADITLFPISAARLDAVEAARLLKEQGIQCNIVHLYQLKPFDSSNQEIIDSLASSKYGGVVIDTDFENGAAKCLAFDIMERIDKKVCVLGLEEKTAGFAPRFDNLPPSPNKICEFIHNIISK